jgi:phosphopantetheinyl transferase
MLYYLGLSYLSNKRPKQAYNLEAMRILSELYGKTITKNGLEKEESGRPYIPGGSADFNISHSGALVAVSMISAIKNQTNLTEINHRISRTGCDVEIIRPRKNTGKIARDFFSSNEYGYICPRGMIDETRFYQIWTLKECIIKLRGLSIFNMVKCPSFINNEGRFFNADTFISFYQYELTGGAEERYILTTALDSERQIPPTLRWFSHFSLDCRSIAEIKAAPSPVDTQSPNI